MEKWKTDTSPQTHVQPSDDVIPLLEGLKKLESEVDEE